MLLLLSCRETFRCLLILAALAVPAIAEAQTYPTRPVKLVVPFAPGGSNDIFGRVIAAQLTDKLGQTVLVDNRAGAGGTVAPIWWPSHRPTATRCC